MRSALAAARQDKEPKEEIPDSLLRNHPQLRRQRKHRRLVEQGSSIFSVWACRELALASENLQGVDRNQQRYAQLLLEQARPMTAIERYRVPARH